MRILCGLILLLEFSNQLKAQPIYYNLSSATAGSSGLRSVTTNGATVSTIYTAVSPVGSCSALAVDLLNNRLFFADSISNSLWSLNMANSTVSLVRSGLTNYPTDLALDVLNQKIYFTTSSSLTNTSTLQRMDYNGSNGVVLMNGTGASGNGVVRCTALAVDTKNSKIFIADAGAQKIWSLSTSGSGLTALATVTNGFPLGLALDVTNQLVYLTASSTLQASNRIHRVAYDGTGYTTIFTASGSVQRCTALDFDPLSATLYLSDAGSNSPALWRLPAAGGTATAIQTAMPATAKKIRWYPGPNSRPAPFISAIQRSGTNIFLSATNGYIGGTYYVLASTNLVTPLAQWVPVYTNVLGASGNFSLSATNAASSSIPYRFYILRVQ